MSHRLIEIESVRRTSSEIPFKVLMQLPVWVPNLADPHAELLVYRFRCACETAGDWQVSETAAREGWVTHVCGDPAVRSEESRRDEIVRLVDRMGGLPWIQGMVAVNDALFDEHPETPCPDCAKQDVCEPECSIQTRPKIDPYDIGHL